MPRFPVRSTLALLACSLLVLAPGVQAGDGHDDPAAKRGKPVAAPAKATEEPASATAPAPP